MENCDEVDVIDFIPIKGDLPYIPSTELSTDQKYLFYIPHSISEGFVSDGVADRQAGKMNHARWLTTANKILRLFIGLRLFDDPPKKLQTSAVKDVVLPVIQ